DRIHVRRRQRVRTSRCGACHKGKEPRIDFAGDATDKLRYKRGVRRNRSKSDRCSYQTSKWNSRRCRWVGDVGEGKSNTVDEYVIATDQRRRFKTSSPRRRDYSLELI